MCTSNALPDESFNVVWFILNIGSKRLWDYKSQIYLLQACVVATFIEDGNTLNAMDLVLQEGYFLQWVS